MTGHMAPAHGSASAHHSPLDTRPSLVADAALLRPSAEQLARLFRRAFDLLTATETELLINRFQNAVVLPSNQLPSRLLGLNSIPRQHIHNRRIPLPVQHPSWSTRLAQIR